MPRNVHCGLYLTGLLALLGGGCTVIVGGDPPPTFACRIEAGTDPCRALDPPQRCVIGELGEGTCQPEVCGVELCGNTLDDDCDGLVDEGATEVCNDVDDDCDGITDEDLDDDMDEFSGCRTGPGAFDCDDREPRVNPSENSQEICDGLDNDCDELTPDGFADCDPVTETCDSLAGGCVEVSCLTRPTLCAADQFCDGSTSPPTCQPVDASCFNIACTGDGVRCNPTTGNCVMGQADGSICDHDSECESNLCVPAAALRASSDLGSARGVCGRSCCDDGNCPDGSRCWLSGTGARACVQDSLLEMGTHGVPSGEACAARSECAQECVLTFDDAYDLGDRASMTCGAPFTARGGSCSAFWNCDGLEDCFDGTCGGGLCESVEDCPNGLCVGSFCADACGSTEDCPRSTGYLGRTDPACQYAVARSTAGRDDYVSFCFYDISGSATQGMACSSDSDCRDFACVDAKGNPFATVGRACADTCCNDDDCGSDQQCRPISIRSHWENHCLPEPLFPPLGIRPT